MKSRFSEEEILRGIRMHDSAVLEFIYRVYFPVIESFVIHHQGSSDEAKDVFQEGMIISYRKIRAGSLVLSCKFGTYLYAVCKKVWIQERKKALLHAEKLRNQALVVHDPGPVEDPLMDQYKQELFGKHFSQLSEDCQKILSMFFNHHSVEEIQKAMNYKDIHHAADRKYRCKKSLIRRIMNDPLFKTLKNETR
jgi:DNA-directed RNA polymerase specialized sigma24 family protein